MNQEQNTRRTPNDPKLSDGGGLARPLHGGGKAAAEAAGVTARSRSLQRLVRRCGRLGIDVAIVIRPWDTDSDRARPKIELSWSGGTVRDMERRLQSAQIEGAQ